MRLIIAEKPSMGRTIAQALGAYKRNDGYIEGNGWLISWCFGHLYELCDPEEYIDPNWKKGDKADWAAFPLPFYPENWAFKYSVKNDAGAKKQIKLLRDLMNREDVDKIFAAGDADREGEVIVRLVIDQNLKPGSGKRLCRMWLPALTDEAITEAVVVAKDLSRFENLYQAGRARAAVDWTMGIELTRYASVKSKAFIRVGRCVTPIVNQVVQREKEIRDFVPVKYFAVQGILKGQSGDRASCKAEV